MSKPADAFWQFSLTVYARPGVAEACLGLQDRLGLDVNLLLFCCWAGRRGRALSEADVRSLRAAVGPWHDEVVRPLRRARRWLKGREALASGAAGDLRADIKAQELEAERIEQTLLAETVPCAEGAADPAAAAGNLLAYLNVRDAPLDRPLGETERDSLATLLAGACPSLTRQDAARLLA